MNSETIKSALDIVLSMEQLDIEIADDLIKSSAFVVTLSSALLIFTLTQLHNTQMNNLFVNFFGYLSLILICLTLFIETHIYKSYIQFRAYSRNMIMAYKTIYSEVLFEIENGNIDMSTISSKDMIDILGGEIGDKYKSIIMPKGLMLDTKTTQNHYRYELDKKHRLQRKLFIFSFLTLIIFFLH